jgi:hypothetical protein
MQYFWHGRDVKVGFWRDETSTQADVKAYREWRTETDRIWRIGAAPCSTSSLRLLPAVPVVRLTPVEVQFISVGVSQLSVPHPVR